MREAVNISSSIAGRIAKIAEGYWHAGKENSLGRRIYLLLEGRHVVREKTMVD